MMIEAEQAIGEVVCGLVCCIIILGALAFIGHVIRGNGSKWI